MAAATLTFFTLNIACIPFTRNDLLLAVFASSRKQLPSTCFLSLVFHLLFSVLSFLFSIPLFLFRIPAAPSFLVFFIVFPVVSCCYLFSVPCSLLLFSIPYPLFPVPLWFLFPITAPSVSRVMLFPRESFIINQLHQQAAIYDASYSKLYDN